MKHIVKNLMLVLFVCLTFSLNAQNVRLQRSGNIEIDQGISPTEVNQIVITLEAALNEYSKAMTLYDENQKRVTVASIDYFGNLFSPNAKVMKDYTEYTSSDLIPFKEYGLDIYNKMKIRGLEVNLLNAEIISITDVDAFGFYQSIIKVKKKIFNYTTQDGKVMTEPSGRIVEQRISFEIYNDDLDRANITIIRPGADVKPADEHTRLITISPTIGSSAISSDHSQYWMTNHSDNQLNVSGGLNYSFGVGFLSDKFITAPKNSNRKLAWNIGVRFSSFEIKSQLNSYNLENFLALPEGGDSGDEYSRIVRDISVDESVRINALEIPLGISYRFLNKPTSLVYLHARFIPAINLGANSKIEGRGYYDGILSLGSNLSEFRIRRMMATLPENIDDDDAFGPYRVSDDDQNINISAEPEVSGTSFAFQLSPEAYFSFVDDSQTWGVSIGLDFSYLLKSPLIHVPIDDPKDAPLKFDDDYKLGSIQSYFSTRLSRFNYGIRLGIFQRFNSEP